jgi:hypothetical protein
MVNWNELRSQNLERRVERLEIIIASLLDQEPFKGVNLPQVRVLLDDNKLIAAGGTDGTAQAS